MASPQELQVIHGNCNFAQNLYTLLSKKEGNVFFSPLSIHSALSVLYQGADGVTKDALTKVLGSVDAASALEGYKSILQFVKKVEKMDLVMANKIYYNRKIGQLNPDFKNTMKTFEGEVDEINFETKSAAAKIINKWVEKKTNGKIKNLVTENTVTDTTCLLLINAIYFKSDWMSKFNKSFTKDAEFLSDKNVSVTVKMMYQKRHYDYAFDNALKAQVIEIPYQSNFFNMMIILPSKECTINAVEASLQKVKLEKIRENLKDTEVCLYLPKFKMEATLNLNDALSQIGLKNLFDQKEANFSKLLDVTEAQNLYVSEVIQKAFIEVNETGTVAAAATKVSMMVGSAPGAPAEPVIFKVDRPAIFMLLSLHNATPNILFYGRLCSPEN